MAGKKEAKTGLLINPFEKAAMSCGLTRIANFAVPPAVFEGDSFYVAQGSFRVFANTDKTFYISVRKPVEMYLVTVESAREILCHIAIYKNEMRVLPNFVVNETGVTQKFMFNSKYDYLAELPAVTTFRIRLQKKKFCQRVDLIRSGGRPVSIIMFGSDPVMVRFNGDYACNLVKRLLSMDHVQTSEGFDAYEKRDRDDSSDEESDVGTTNSEDSEKEARSEKIPKIKQDLRVRATVPAGYLEVFANRRYTESEIQGCFNIGENQDLEFPNDVAPIMRKASQIRRIPERVEKPSEFESDEKTKNVERKAPAPQMVTGRKPLEIPEEDVQIMASARARREASRQQAEEAAGIARKVNPENPAKPVESIAMRIGKSAKMLDKAPSATPSKPPSEISETSVTSGDKAQKPKKENTSAQILKELVQGLAKLVANAQTPSDEE